jgi:phenol hydroxylase P3 protein
MEWLSAKYPTTFDKYYRPRWDHIKKLAAAGTPFKNFGLAKLCQTCQLPVVFTEPGDPTTLCNRETVYKGEKYHFCSDGCQDIFAHEPEKYVQAWLPMPALFQDPFSGDIGAWMNWVGMQDGVDNGDFVGSQDERNFEKWRGMAMSNK